MAYDARYVTRAARSSDRSAPQAGAFTDALLTPAWRPVNHRHMAACRRRMARLAATLERAYHTPDLGNLSDPLDEAVYIVLTYQTDLPRARAVWLALRERYPSWRSVLDASATELESVLAPGGFQRSRTKLICQLLEAVQELFGEFSLQGLRGLPLEEAERRLRALPGLDLKGARCVLLYSLGQQVFPVDSNAFRFMQRYGVAQNLARYRRRATHDELQALIRPMDRHSLHVNLVIHGQRTCLPKNPRCSECPVRRTCASRQ